MGNKVEFGLVTGKPFSGKSMTCDILAKNHGFTVLDMDKIEEKVKAGLGSEEEPFEGEVPLAEIEKYVVEVFATARKSGGKKRFVFDSFKHDSEDKFMNFVSKFGNIDFILFLTCEERTVKERWMKKNEAEDVPEDQVEEIKQQSSISDSRRNKLIDCVHKAGDKTNIMNIDTSKVASLESLSRELNNNFSAKVVLVNHEK